MEDDNWQEAFDNDDDREDCEDKGWFYNDSLDREYD